MFNWLKILNGKWQTKQILKVMQGCMLLLKKEKYLRIIMLSEKQQ